jgi:nitroreductase
MEVLEAIRTRRTTKSFRPDPVPRDLIEQTLEAAVWAPNHRLTEPWRFTVVQGAALEQLAELRRRMTVEYLQSRQPSPDAAQVAREGESAYAKAVAAPVTVAVAITQHADATIREEDYAAAAAAIQNMLLAAHALGLAAFWSTNNLVRYPPALALLGVAADERVVGLVQIGYPAQQREQRRIAAAERTRWLG